MIEVFIDFVMKFVVLKRNLHFKILKFIVMPSITATEVIKVFAVVVTVAIQEVVKLNMSTILKQEA